MTELARQVKRSYPLPEEIYKKSPLAADVLLLHAENKMPTHRLTISDNFFSIKVYLLALFTAGFSLAVTCFDPAELHQREYDETVRQISKGCNEFCSRGSP